MLNVHVQLDNDDSDSTNSIGLDENLVLKLVRKLQPKLVSVLITVTDIALWGMPNYQQPSLLSHTSLLVNL